MSNIKVISKETHNTLIEINENKISLSEASVVVLRINKEDVLKIEQSGTSAIITLKNGEHIVIENFFNNTNYQTENSLVFEDDQHKLLWVQFTDANGALLDNITYGYIENIDPLLYHDSVAGPLAWSFIPTAAAGILWWAHNDHKNSKDTTAPAKPTPPTDFVDNQGDNQGTFPGGTQTDDTTPGIVIGPVTPGETPTLIVDGVEVPSTYDPTTGTLTPVNPLPEGPHEVTYTITDPAGNTSVPSDPIQVVVDTTAPAKPTPPEGFVDNQGDNQGTFPGGTQTDDTTPGIVIGPVTPGETPTLIVDGVEVPSTYDPTTGTLTPVNPLPEGPHEVTYTITDPAGNTSVPSDPIQVVVDTTAPAKPTPPEGFVDNQGDNQGTFPGGTQTDDTTPGIVIGPVTPGETPTLIVDGVEVPSTYDPTTGTLTPVNPLPEGPHEVTYTITDPAGNTSVPSDPIQVVVDTTAPAKPTPPEGFVDNQGDNQGTFPGGTQTDDTTPGIVIGPVTPGETPTLIVDGVEVPSTYDPTTGTLTPVNPLPEGPHEVTYTITDPAGNTSVPSDPIQVVVDTTAPAKPTPPTDFVDNQGDNQGTFPGGTQTDDTTPGIVIGPVTPGETPTLIVDGVEVPSTYDPTTGTLTPVNPLPEGPHEVTYTITDPAGNTSVPSDPIQVVVDTTAPAKPTPPEGFVDNQGDNQGTFPGGTQTDDTTPGIVIGPVTPGETPTLIVDGVEVPSTYDPTTGTLTPVNPLPEGPHEVTYTITDPAGNTSVPSDPIQVVVDTTAPAKPTPPTDFVDNQGDNQGTFPGGTQTDDTTPGIVIGPVTPGETPTLIVDGVEVPSTYDPTTGTLTPVNPLPEGPHEVTYTITDPAGNTSVPSDPIQVVVDTTAPAKPTPPTDFVDNQGDNQGTFPGGTQTDDTTPGIVIGPVTPGETPTLIVDGVEVPSTYDPTTGTLTPVNPLPEGPHEVTYTITDPAGNTSVPSDPIQVVVDTTAPAKPTPPTDFVDNQGDNQGTFPGGTQTDDTTPGIVIGPVTPGETPTLIVDGVEVPSTYDPTTGTLTPVNPLPEGPHEVTYTITDPAGNTSVPSDPIQVVVDTTAPAKPTPPEGFVDNQGDNQGTFPGGTQTDDTTPGIVIGPVTPGETPTLIVDGVEVPSTYDPTTGTLTPVNPLPEGPHEVTYTITDPAGNTSVPSDPIQVVVDTTAPAKPTPPTDFVDNQGDNQGTFPGGTQTDDTTPGIVIGPVTPGETPTLIVDGVEVPSTYDPTTGTLTPVNPLPEGPHEVTYTITDPAGNTSVPSDPIQVVVDTTAPAKPTPPTDFVDNQGDNQGTFPGGTQTDDTTPGIVIGPVTPGETPTLIVDGVEVPSTYDPTTGTLTPVNPLPEGPHEVTYTITDPAGNTSVPSDPIQVVVDTTAPAKPTPPTDFVDNQGDNQGTFPGGTQTDDTTPGIVIGPVTPGETPTLIVDGVEVPSTYDPTTGTLTPVNPLPEGPHEVTYTITDPAGNTSVPSDPIQVVVDTTAPAKPTPPTDFVDNQGDNQGTFPGGTQTDDTTPGIVIGPVTPGETPTLIVDGVEVPSTYDPTTGTLTPVNPLPEGPHEVTYTITDPAGNTSVPSDPIQVVVDTTAPAKPTPPEGFVDNQGDNQGTFPGGTQTDDTTPGIVIGPVTPGETPTLIVDGVEVPSTYDPTTGTLTPVNPLPEGPHEVTYTITDPAGNTSVPSDPIQVVVDTTAPAKPTPPTDFVDNQGDNQGTFPGGTQTDDTTPGIVIGPVTPGETPTLIVDGVEVPSTYDPTTGTLTPVNPLPEGPHEVTYTITDPAGNTSVPSDPIQVVVDTTAPAKPTPPTDFVDNQGDNQGTFPGGTQTDDTTPGIVIGPVTPGETPTLIVDGVEVPSTYDPTTGTLTPVNPLPEGPHEVTYTITDPAGNTSVPSDPIQVVVDTTAPAKPTPPTDFVDNQGDNQGTFPGGTQTDDTTPGIVIGPVTPGETPTLIVDGVEVPSTYDPTTGTLTPVNPLPEGPHEVTYTITDPAGNTSVPSDPIQVVVDTTAPAKPTPPTDFVDNQGDNQGTFPGGTQTDDTTPGIVIGPVTPGETPTLIVDGVEVPSTYDPTTGTLTPVNPLPEGPHEVTYTITDPAGNTSVPSDSIQVVVDTTAPAKPTPPTDFVDNQGDNQGTFPGGTQTDDTTPGIVIGPVTPGETPTLIVDGVEVPSTYDPTTGTLTPVNPLPEGPHEVTYTITDPAGNTSVPSDPIQVVVDTTAPAKPTPPTDFVDNQGDNQGTFPGGTQTDDTTPGIVIGPVTPGETPTLIVDGVEVPSTYDPTTGTLTPVNPLPEGPHEVTYTITDPAGNTSVPSDPIQVVVDTTAPAKPTPPTDFVDNQGDNQGTFPGGTQTDDTTPGIVIGPVTPGETPTLIVDGVEVPSTYDPTTGTLTPVNPLPEGPHEVTYTITDPAGNTSVPSDPIQVVVDTTAPAKPTPPTDFVDNQGDNQGTFPGGTQTDDTTPGIVIGPVTPGETPTLIVDGVEVPSTYDPTTGTLTPVNPLPEGPHEVTYTITDPAGNTSVPSDPIQVVVDTTAPAKPTPPTDFVDNQGDNQGTFPGGTQTDDTTPGIVIGPVTPGETPTLIVDGVEVPSTYDPTTGTLTPVNPLPEGPHEVTYTITDPAGNTSVPSDPIQVVVDTTAPAKPTPPTDFVDNQGDNQGTFPGGTQTDDTTPGIVIGPVTPGETPTLIVDGVEVPSTYDPTTGTLTPVNPLPEGPHEVTYTITDPAGNTSVPSDPIQVVVDTTAPTQSAIISTVTDDVAPGLGNVANGGATNDTTPSLGGTISAGLNSGERVVILRDGAVVGTATVTGTTWTFADAGLADGSTYIYTARVEDAAGNRGAISTNYSISVDSSAPTQTVVISNIVDDVAPQTGNVTNGGTTNDVTPELQGTISTVLGSGEVVAVYRDGVKVGTATVTNTTWTFADTGLADGVNYVYTARVEDAAGNQGSVSNNYAVSVDTSAPTQSVIISTVTDDVAPGLGNVANGGATNDTTPLLGGTISAGLNSGERVVILRDGAVVGTATVTGTTWTFADAGLVDGSTYIYTARVEDAAGNRGAISTNYSISVDSSAPTQTVVISNIVDDVAPQTGNVTNGGTTNDVTPELQGTISTVLGSGEVVAVYRDGVKVGTATVTNTTWTFADTGLADGVNYVYTARVEDAAGNQGSVSNNYAVSVDTSAPTQSVIISTVTDDVAPGLGNVANGGATNDTTPLLGGTISAGLNSGERVVILRDGAVVGTATVTGTTWTFADAGLVDGSTYIYTARVEDAAGNRGAISTNYSISVDSSAPTQTVVISNIVDDVAPQTGNVTNGGTTNDVTPELQGTISTVLGSGEVVAVYRDGVKVGTATVTNTTWTFADTGLADGVNYVYTARVEDAAGNQGSVSNNYAVSVDTSAPTQSVIISTVTDDVAPGLGNVANGGATNDTTPSLGGTISAGLNSGERVVILRDGAVVGTATVTGTTWTFADAGLADGSTYIYTARVEDAAGNRGAISTNYSISVDSSAPTQTVVISNIVDDVAPQTGNVTNGGTTNDVTPELQGTISTVLGSGEVVAVYRDGVKVGTATVTNTTWTFADTGLADGVNYVYTARVEDAAGNQGSVSNNYAVSVDTSAPTQSVIISTVTDDVAPGLGNVANGGATNDTTPLLGGTISAGLNSGERVVILRDGAVVGTATVTGTTWTFADAGLVDGSTYIYTARVEDAAGNRGAISTNYSISVDSSAPTQTVVISNIVDDVAPQTGNVTNGGTTNDVTPELQGTISTVLGSGEVVAVYRDGVKVGTATVTNTTWTFADTGLADGVNYVYTARVEDAAGNQGSVSNNYAVSVDTSAPTQSVIISTVTDDVAPGLGNVANGGATNDTTPLLGGTISAGLNSGERVVILRDGAVVGTATVTGTTWTFADAGLVDGSTYIYTARVEDAAGNRGAISTNYSISVDSSAPTQTVVISNIVDDVAPQTGNVTNGGTTNDTTPELQGTISTVLGSGEVVAVYRDGVKVGTATVTNTTWTYTDSGLASESTYSYSARVEDAAGNTGNSSANYSVTIQTGGPTQTTMITAVQDDFAPQTGVVANNGATNDTTPLIEGTISAALNVGESVVVVRDGVVIGTATVTGTTWTFNDSGLSNGLGYTYTAYVQNAASISGGVSNSYTINIDTIAPIQTTTITTVVDNVAPGLGNVANGAFTNDDTPEVQGTISAALGSGEVVAMYRDGIKVGTATVSGTTWTYADAGLASGSSYSYTARVEDAAGNQGSVSNNYAISVDTSGSSQSVQILSVIDDFAPQTGVVANNGATNDTTPQLTGSISTALTGTETVVVLRDGVVIGTATVTGTTWTFNDSGLSNGNSYVYTARVETAGGNQSPASSAYTITVDTVAPTQTTTITTVVDNVAPGLGNVANGAFTNDDTPEVQGTISAALGSGEVVAMYRDGIKVGTATVSGTTWTYADAGLASGSSYSYTARVEDAAGNQGSVSNNYAISVDTSGSSQSVQILSVIDDFAPQTGVVANNGATNDTTPQLTGSISTALTGTETVVVLRDGVVIGTATVTGTTWTFNDSGLSNGNSYVYTARVETAGGNQSPASSAYTITVDTVAPAQTTTITTVVDNVAPGLGNVANGAFTNDDTPEVQGTISAALGSGEVVAMYRDGIKVGTATVSGTTWTYADAGLASGSSYSYTARVEDAAGNQGSVSNNYAISVDTSGSSQSVQILSVIDDFAPQTGVVANNGATNDTTPQLTGSISTALTGTETVVVLRDGVVIGTATVTGTTWTFNDSGLSNGNSYVYTARVETAGGNQSPASSAYTITVDTVAPAQTTTITTVVDNVAPGLGNVANGAFTNDDTPEVQGTISAALGSGEVVAMYRDGIKVGTATVSGTTWTYADAGLASGSSYSYTARVEDAAGNQGSVSNNYAISVDTSGSSQSVQILSVIDDFAPQTGVVANNGATNDTTPQLTGSISTALTGTETVVVLRDGVVIGTATVTGTTWTFNDSGLSNGNSYVYTARVETAGGNQSPASSAYTITVDTVAPTQTTTITTVVDNVAPGLGNVANGAFTNDDTPEVQGTISAALGSGEVVAMYRDGIKVGTATVSGTTWTYADAGLASGSSYSYTARVEDAAGNQGSVSNNYAISVDTSGSSQSVQILSVIDDFAPQTGVVANNGATNDTTPQLTGSISTALTGTETVVVLRDGVVIGTATVTGTTWTFNDSGLSNGNSYVYTARVETAGGNQSPASSAYTITVDTVAPTQTTTITTVVDNVAPGLGNVANGAFTNDDTPEVQGTISAALGSGEVVAMYRDGIKVGTATVSGTTWTYADAGLASGSSYSYTARVEDAAGNQGSVSNNYAISVDTSGSSQSVQILSVIDDFAPQTGVVANNGATNDTTPQLTGSISTALTGTETVVVLRDGVVIGTATVTGTTWTFNDSGLSNGNSYVYTARVETAGGNQSPASSAYTITVDTVAPTQTTVITQVIDDVDPQTGIVANNGATNDVTPSIEGTISTALGSGEVVVVYRDGVKVGTATVSGTTWTYADNGLVDGTTYSYIARVEDAAGNVGVSSGAYAITVDTTAPSASNLVDITAISTDTGTSSTDFITSDTTLTVSGTLTTALNVGEKVQISNDDGITWIDAITTGTTWSLVDAVVHSSNFTYQARVIDAAGNIGSTDSQAIVIDTTAPTSVIDITAISTDTGISSTDFITSDTTLTVSGMLTTALNVGEKVQVSNNGGITWVDAITTGTTWSLVDAVVHSSNFTYQARVIDAAGNIGSTDSQAIVIDTTAPTSVIDITAISTDTGTSSTDFITSDTTLTVSGTLTTVLNVGEKVQVSNDGGITWVDAITTGTTWSLVDAVVHNSNFTYQARVIDIAGNIGSVDSQAIVIDTTPPTSVIDITAISTDTGTSSTDFITSDTTLTVSGTLATALGVGEKVQVSNDSGVTWIDAITTGTTWSLVDAVVHSSNFTYQARVIDTAGNIGSTDSQAIVIDTTPPTQLVTITNYTDDVGGITGNFITGSTTDDRTPLLNGTVNSTLGADEQIAVYQVNGGNTSFLGYANTVGTVWTYEVSSNLNDGQSYTFYARVVDTSGNLGSQSNNLLINVDLTVNVNTQNTLDTTPIISGSTGFKILPGEYLEVTVNGKTYSSQTGAVVIDPLNNTWYVQIPTSDVLSVNSYNVVAILKDATGAMITQDDTTNELIVAATPVVTVGAGGGDLDQKATAVTIGQDGSWRIHTNQTMLDANGTSSSTLGSFSSTSLVSNNGGTGYNTQNYVQNATFIDYNRDGLMDLFAVDNRYDDGQQMFYYNGTTYTPYQVGAFTNAPQTGAFAGDANTDGSANTWSWYGGIVAIDKNGDGLVDMIIGDQTPNDSAIRDGYGSQIVLNNDGTVTGMSKDGNFATDYAADATHQPIGKDNASPDMELSGVDINNDGIIDFAFHATNVVVAGSEITANGAISSNQNRLVISKGTNTDAWNVDQIIDNVFQRNDDDPNIGNGVAMTWADYNGDGFMDLFLGRGNESDTASSGADNNAGEYASRIYFNDGTGRLIFSDPNNDGIGNPTAAGKYVFTDNLAGGASIALDWNHDGKMDIIELPGMGNSGGVTNAANTGPINLYTNTSSGGVVSFTTNNLLTQIGKTTIGTSSTTGTNSGPVTGAIAIDIDWDGDRDLLAFTVNGQTTYIENKNNVAYGTSIHLRILDEEGINSLYGNTVQLIDESTGLVVSTQIINAQSGNQTNDSTAIVDFYNLDASKSYSAVILRQKNNAAADVGGVATVGSNTVEIVNAAWAGLKATESNNAYVLTTEASNNAANANKANGIVGTGYNDTFFATLGNDIYNGAGGTTTISGVKSWSNTGGLDIVDYKLAGSTAIVVDLSNTSAQNTGFGTATFKNIEGIAGGSGNDVLTGNALNNYFNGRGGNDIFNLGSGGQDTLMYKLLNSADATGGNGSDIVNGFKVGTVEATPNADIIDIKDLLVGYTADTDGAAHYINGIATIDAGDTIANYLSVTQVGNNTIVSIDRDGLVGGTNYAPLVTLNNVHTDLETLLANHQIIIG